MVAATISPESISFQPFCIVSPPCLGSVDGSQPPSSIATMELSNLDLLHNYYNSVLLLYNAPSAPPQQQAVKQQWLQDTGLAVQPHDDIVTRLRRALEKLLVLYPSAAGLFVHNDAHGRLELRYPTANSCTSITSPTAAPADTSVILSHTGNQFASSETRHHRRTSQSSDESLSDSYGVPFHVAHANVTLSDLGDVSDAHPSLDVLYPSRPTHASFVMAIQVTIFKCGGFSIAHTCSHLYADGYTAATILQNLCSIARGVGPANPPDFCFSRREILGAREPPSPTTRYTFLGVQKRMSTTEPPTLTKSADYLPAIRYPFPMNSLEALRSYVLKQGGFKKCSRNQVLMALLWGAYARVRLYVQGRPRNQTFELRFPINLRTRGIPRLTEKYVGNALFHCTIKAKLSELCEKPLAYVVEMIKSAANSWAWAEDVQSIIDDVELRFKEGLVPYIGEDHVGITSLVGLPFYDTDCGWGRPVYLARPSRQLSNMCIILDHPAAKAWNVLCVFGSVEERQCFEGAIAKHIDSNLCEAA